MKSNLCHYDDAYILVKGDIIVTAPPENQVTIKNYARFTTCIYKADGTTTDDAEDLDLFMLMYNLIEYSSNHSETIGSLWFHSKDGATNFSANIANNDNYKSFEYETKLLENIKAQPAPNNANGIPENAAITVSLKYLTSF